MLAVCSTEKNVTNWVAFLCGGHIREEIFVAFTQKKNRAYFSGGLHDNHGKRNQLHVKTQRVPRSKHAPARLFKKSVNVL